MTDQQPRKLTLRPLSGAELDNAAAIDDEDKVLAQTEWRQKVHTLPNVLDATIIDDA